MTTPDGLFDFDGTLHHPSEFTRGPWRPDAQHGGPPAALLAHVCQPLVAENEFLAQLAVELVRPVPLTPLRATVDRTRVSGRVARIRARLESESTTVAEASALILQKSDLDDPEWIDAGEQAPGVPTDDRSVDPPRWASGDVTTYHRNAVEHRFTSGTFREPGPAVDWVRLRLPVVSGSEPTGLERLAAAADFGSGISAVYGPTSRVGLINAFDPPSPRGRLGVPRRKDPCRATRHRTGYHPARRLLRRGRHRHAESPRVFDGLALSDAPA